MWIAWDTAIFRAIHLGWRQPWLDPVMKFLTDPEGFKIPILALLGAVMLLRGRKGIVGVLVLALTVAAADQLSSKVLKPVFKRTRPAVGLIDARPLFGVRRSNSFPSGHATTSFAAAQVASGILPQARIPMFALAAAVSVSRIYVGDHWPSDVFSGAILGLTVGFLGRRALGRLWRTLPWTRDAGAAAPSGAPSRPRRGGASRIDRAGTRYTRARSRSGRWRARRCEGRRRWRPEDRGRIDRLGGVSRER